MPERNIFRQIAREIRHFTDWANVPATRPDGEITNNRCPFRDENNTCAISHVAQYRSCEYPNLPVDKCPVSGYGRVDLCDRPWAKSFPER